MAQAEVRPGNVPGPTAAPARPAGRRTRLGRRGAADAADLAHNARFAPGSHPICENGGQSSCKSRARRDLAARMLVVPASVSPAWIRDACLPVGAEAALTSGTCPSASRTAARRPEGLRCALRRVWCGEGGDQAVGGRLKARGVVVRA